MFGLFFCGLPVEMGVNMRLVQKLWCLPFAICFFSNESASLRPIKSSVSRDAALILHAPVVGTRDSVVLRIVMVPRARTVRSYKPTNTELFVH